MYPKNQPESKFPGVIVFIFIITLILCPLSLFLEGPQFISPPLMGDAGGGCIISAVSAQTDDPKEIEPVLTSAERLFKAMKARNYPAIWNPLSKKTKDSIVDSIYKNSKKDGIEYSRDQINHDFQIGGLISKSYWNHYLSVFDPDIPLEQSKWKMDFIKGNTAQIRIQYKKADKPVFLHMYKENIQWKVGLEETFSPRKWLLK